MEAVGALDLRDVPEPGGTLELGDASELGGTDDFVSAPTTPLPDLEERVSDHHRAVPSDREQGPRDSDEIREGVVKMETRALNQETAPGLTSLIELDGGSRILHALLAEKAASREPAKPPNRLLQETEQTPAADNKHPRQGIRALGRMIWFRSLVDSTPMGLLLRILGFQMGF